MYFYIIIIICVAVSVSIIVTSEDLKDSKRYRKHIKIALIIGSIGILMEILGWNYLCRFQCILLTFSPFVTLVIIKGTMYFFKKMTTIEPYEIHRGKLSDGFWQRNKGNLKHKRYYTLYSAVITALPCIIILISYIILKENMC